MAKLDLTVGQIIDIDITGLNHQGAGVGRYEGIALFVPRTIPGEKARVKLRKIKKNYAEGELLEVLDASFKRIRGNCEYHEGCGGCQFQHLAYEAQLEAKTQMVKDVFKRIGKLEVEVKPTLGMMEPLGYRNKVHFQVTKSNNQIKLGFFGEDFFEPIEVEKCLLIDNEINKVAQIIQEVLTHYKIETYDWKSNTGLLRHVIIRKSNLTGEMMIIFALTGKWPEGKVVAEKLMQKEASISSVILNLNEAKTRQVLGRKFTVLKGKEKITEGLGELKFKLSAPAFYQVNPLQTEVLYNKALEYCDLKGKEKVVDAYSGIGTIALFLAQKAKEVIGIEIVPEAVEDAKENARLNNLENAEFITGKVEEVLPDLVNKGLKADIVLLDPPRKGCDGEVLKAIEKIKPEKIVYVSCDPSTLARDCNILSGMGYQVKEVQPVDMFAWTSHVETVVLIEKCNL